MPQTPVRRVSILKTYLESTKSPSVATLQSLNKVRSSEELENGRVTDSILKDVKSMVHSTKTQRSKDSVLTIQLFFSAVSGEHIKQNRQKNNLAKRLGVKRSNTTTGNKTRTQVAYLDKQEKDVKRERLAPRVFVSYMILVLGSSQTDVYCEIEQHTHI
ncbi:hypothetical protein MAR_032975 [Mya arenaria]|uniref:Uncharacterized protein n=1 Tax=Mya arenaria TaxID=6604 RepID=A0ABY7G7P6_MYAAR|nr:hypothetical protein MAR_032975 [Mya arenaria]